MKALIISDTHQKHRKLDIDDNVDIVIHCGDFSNNDKDAESFLKWYSELNIKHKLIIPGNHDSSIEFDEHKWILLAKELGITMLIDSSIVIDGIKFYGTPWTPEFYNWSYMKEEYDLKYKFDKIPTDTQVLISHGPPRGILDTTYYGNKHVGSSSLIKKIMELNEHKFLKLVLFGHIHESAGDFRENGILYVNASSVDLRYEVIKPYIIDLEDFSILKHL